MDHKEGQESMGESSSQEIAHATSKRPYKAPRLRHLGSVRELTLGGTMGAFVDDLGFKKRLPM